MVTVSKEAVAETAHEIRQRTQASLLDEARADPLVQKLLQRFPGAEIVSVRERGVEVEPAVDAGLPNPYDGSDESGGD
jgi:DNA polymerase-3 subunit gamma/tau